MIASAIFTVTQKSPVYSVVGLLVNFLALAALYFTLDAEFLGVIQIVVYSGAILMLFVFVIALLSSGIGPFAEGPNRLPRIALPALLAIVASFGFLAFGLLARAARPDSGPCVDAPRSATSERRTSSAASAISASRSSRCTCLPFEVTAFILMVAVIGVVLIAGDAAPEPTQGTHPAKRRARERESIVKAIK